MPPQSLDEKLRSAIANKRLIRITYDGAERIGEPHDYGKHKGMAKLLFYQHQRLIDHRWKPAPGWKLLHIPKVEACSVTETKFAGSRESSDQKHMTWDEVFARVT